MNFLRFSAVLMLVFGAFFNTAFAVDCTPVEFDTNGGVFTEGGRLINPDLYTRQGTAGFFTDSDCATVYNGNQKPAELTYNNNSNAEFRGYYETHTRQYIFDLNYSFTGSGFTPMFSNVTLRAYWMCKDTNTACPGTYGIDGYALYCGPDPRVELTGDDTWLISGESDDGEYKGLDITEDYFKSFCCPEGTKQLCCSGADEVVDGWDIIPDGNNSTPVQSRVKYEDLFPISFGDTHYWGDESKVTRIKAHCIVPTECHAVVFDNNGGSLPTGIESQKPLYRKNADYRWFSDANCSEVADPDIYEPTKDNETFMGYYTQAGTYDGNSADVVFTNTTYQDGGGTFLVQNDNFVGAWDVTGWPSTITLKARWFKSEMTIQCDASGTPSAEISVDSASSLQKDIDDFMSEQNCLQCEDYYNSVLNGWNFIPADGVSVPDEIKKEIEDNATFFNSVDIDKYAEYLYGATIYPAYGCLGTMYLACADGGNPISITATAGDDINTLFNAIFNANCVTYEYCQNSGKFVPTGIRVTSSTGTLPDVLSAAVDENGMLSEDFFNSNQSLTYDSTWNNVTWTIVGVCQYDVSYECGDHATPGDEGTGGGDATKSGVSYTEKITGGSSYTVRNFAESDCVVETGYVFDGWKSDYPNPNTVYSRNETSVISLYPSRGITFTAQYTCDTDYENTGTEDNPVCRAKASGPVEIILWADGYRTTCPDTWNSADEGAYCSTNPNTHGCCTCLSRDSDGTCTEYDFRGTEKIYVIKQDSNVYLCGTEYVGENCVSGGDQTLSHNWFETPQGFLVVTYDVKCPSENLSQMEGFTKLGHYGYWQTYDLETSTYSGNQYIATNDQGSWVVTSDGYNAANGYSTTKTWYFKWLLGIPPITLPTYEDNQECPGYSFQGWYEDEGYEHKALNCNYTYITVSDGGEEHNNQYQGYLPSGCLINSDSLGEENCTVPLDNIKYTADTCTDKKLYGLWEPMVFPVTLNANGGEFGGVGVRKIYEKYDAGWSISQDGPFNGVTLSDDQLPHRPGYTFDGYYTEQQGGERRGTYANGIWSSSLLAYNLVYTNDTTWYAHWEEAPTGSDVTCHGMLDGAASVQVVDNGVLALSTTPADEAGFEKICCLDKSGNPDVCCEVGFTYKGWKYNDEDIEWDVLHEYLNSVQSFGNGGTITPNCVPTPSSYSIYCMQNNTGTNPHSLTDVNLNDYHVLAADIEYGVSFTMPESEVIEHCCRTIDEASGNQDGTLDKCCPSGYSIKLDSYSNTHFWNAYNVNGAGGPNTETGTSWAYFLSDLFAYGDYESSVILMPLCVPLPTCHKIKFDDGVTHYSVNGDINLYRKDEDTDWYSDADCTQSVVPAVREPLYEYGVFEGYYYDADERQIFTNEIDDGFLLPDENVNTWDVTGLGEIITLKAHWNTISVTAQCSLDSDTTFESNWSAFANPDIKQCHCPDDGDLLGISGWHIKDSVPTELQDIYSVNNNNMLPTGFFTPDNYESYVQYMDGLTLYPELICRYDVTYKCGDRQKIYANDATAGQLYTIKSFGEVDGDIAGGCQFSNASFNGWKFDYNDDVYDFTNQTPLVNSWPNSDGTFTARYTCDTGYENNGTDDNPVCTAESEPEIFHFTCKPYDHVLSGARELLNISSDTEDDRIYTDLNYMYESQVSEDSTFMAPMLRNSEGQYTCDLTPEVKQTGWFTSPYRWQMGTLNYWYIQLELVSGQEYTVHYTPDDVAPHTSYASSSDKTYRQLAQENDYTFKTMYTQRGGAALYKCSESEIDPAVGDNSYESVSFNVRKTYSVKNLNSSVISCQAPEHSRGFKGWKAKQAVGEDTAVEDYLSANNQNLNEVDPDENDGLFVEGSLVGQHNIEAFPPKSVRFIAVWDCENGYQYEIGTGQCKQDVSVKYMCYAGDSDQDHQWDDTFDGPPYTVKGFNDALFSQTGFSSVCSINNSNLSNWYFSGDGEQLYEPGHQFANWSYGDGETFVPGYTATFECGPNGWFINPNPQYIVVALGDGIDVPSVGQVCGNVNPEYSDWVDTSLVGWKVTYPDNIGPSPIPGANCSHRTEYVTDDTFSWDCPTDLHFKPIGVFDEITYKVCCPTMSEICQEFSGGGGPNGPYTTGAAIQQFIEQNCPVAPCQNNGIGDWLGWAVLPINYQSESIQSDMIDNPLQYPQKMLPYNYSFNNPALAAAYNVTISPITACFYDVTYECGELGGNQTRVDSYDTNWPNHPTNEWPGGAAVKRRFCENGVCGVYKIRDYTWAGCEPHGYSFAGWDFSTDQSDFTPENPYWGGDSIFRWPSYLYTGMTSQGEYSWYEGYPGTFTARWERDTSAEHIINLLYEYGGGDPNHYEHYNVVTNTNELYTIYDVGVYKDSERTQEMTVDSNKIDVTRKYVTVTLNANDGEVNDNGWPETVEGSYSYSNNFYMEFLGFYEGATSTKRCINADGYITSAGIEVGKGYTHDVDWYARWKSVTVALPTPIREGYSFAGWYGIGWPAPAGDSVTPNDDITLTARWTKCTYGQFYESGECNSCPDGYADNPSPNSEKECYRKCKWTCSTEGLCPDPLPDGVLSCQVFGQDEEYDGVMYNDSFNVCLPENGTSVPQCEKQIVCDDPFYHLIDGECKVCEDDTVWNGRVCAGVGEEGGCEPGWRSKWPYNWSKKQCYHECENGLACKIHDVQEGYQYKFINFNGDSTEQIEFYGNWTEISRRPELDVCDPNNGVAYCPQVRERNPNGEMMAASKFASAPVEFRDKTLIDVAGTRYIIGRRLDHGGNVPGTGLWWSHIVGPAQLTHVDTNEVAIIYPVTQAPYPGNNEYNTLLGYANPQNNGTIYVSANFSNGEYDMELNGENAQSIISRITAVNDYGKRILYPVYIGCTSGQFYTYGGCNDCPANFPNSDPLNATSEQDCYADCTANCGETGCPAMQNATCQYNVVSVSGRKYNNGLDECTVSQCEYTHECNPGYYLTADDTCEPEAGYPINLDDRIGQTSHGSNVSPNIIYTIHNTGVYLDSPRTEQMTTSENNVTVPTRYAVVTLDANGTDAAPATVAWDENTPSSPIIFKNINFEFNGFYKTMDNNSEDDLYIGTNGYVTTGGIVAAKGYSRVQKWYAQWTAGTIARLPEPVRTGFEFDGWYTQQTGGNPVGHATQSIQSDVTYYAHWKECSNGQYYWDGFCTYCPVDFPNSDPLTATSINHCYNNCSENCDASGCVEGQNGIEHCNYVIVSYLGKLYYPGQSQCVLDNNDTIKQCKFTVTCVAGYETNEDENGCVPKRFYASYTCGNMGTGTPPEREAVYYGTSYHIKANNDMCVRTGYTFAGWEFDLNQNVYSDHDATVEWNYNSDGEFKARWCENCQDIANGSCSLTITNPGICEYEITCDYGYERVGKICKPKTNLVLTYKPNGGVPNQTYQRTYTFDQPFTTLGFADVMYVKPEHIMTRWELESDIGRETFVNGFAEFSTNYTYRTDGNINLLAHWEQCSCAYGVGVALCDSPSINNNKCNFTAECEPGYINPLVDCNGASCVAQCKQCPVGTISVGNECVPCECEPKPDGGAASCGTLSIENNTCGWGPTCKPGYHNPISNCTGAGNIDCKPYCEMCGEGTYGADGISCTACPDGYTAPAGSTSIEDCYSHPIQYTISYQSNNGLNQTYNQNVYYNDAFTTATKTGTGFTRAGYIIDRWEVVSGGTNTFTDYDTNSHLYYTNPGRDYAHYIDVVNTTLRAKWKICPEGTYEFGDICRDCPDNYTSYEGAATIDECFLYHCDEGYHIEHGECVDDVKTCVVPNAPNATGGKRVWNDELKAYGPCITVECDYGYHISGNACVKDNETCTVPNGHGEHTWDGSTNQWGTCYVTNCDPGYYESGNECVECENRRVNDEVAVSGYIYGCEIATCMYQGQKYALQMNECVPICTADRFNEDPNNPTGTIRWDDNTKRCIRTCNPGYKMW